MRERIVRTSDLAQMIALGEEGLSRQEIADRTGWAYWTVRKHIGHLVCGVGATEVDVPRYRRMIKAAAAAEYGQRDAIARRFGLKDARSLKVVLVTARRRVAEADQISAGS